MGVAGTGKTTIGRMLSERLGWQFYDGDDYHPKENVEKMKKGIPLTDDDRWPWLRAIEQLINSRLSDNQKSIIACSALKREYREYLKQDKEDIVFVYLKGDEKILRERISSRHGHFAGVDLLESQLDTIEEPHNVLTVDISRKPEEITDYLIERLELSKSYPE